MLKGKNKALFDDNVDCLVRDLSFVNKTGYREEALRVVDGKKFVVVVYCEEVVCDG